MTPKSYLSFINGYKNIYNEKVKFINEQAERMNIGKGMASFVSFRVCLMAIPTCYSMDIIAFENQTLFVFLGFKNYVYVYMAVCACGYVCM